MQFTQTSQKFKSEMEVRVAFSCGKLPWLKGDTPAMLEIRTDSDGRQVIDNHRFVRVLDVCGLTSAHDPLYLCETESREMIQVDSAILVPWQRLLLDDKGQPSEYARWQQLKIQNRRARELAGHRTEVVLVASLAR